MSWDNFSRRIKLVVDADLKELDMFDEIPVDIISVADSTEFNTAEELMKDSIEKRYIVDTYSIKHDRYIFKIRDTTNNHRLTLNIPREFLTVELRLRNRTFIL